MCSKGKGNGSNGNGNGANGNGKRHRLTEKQRAFVEHLFGEAQHNGTEAARLAGYGGTDASRRAIASENLTKPNIQEEIRRRWAVHGVVEDEIKYRFADWMRFDPGVLLDPHGGISWDAVREHSRFVKKFWYDKEGRLCVELHDPLRAAENLAKFLGMYQADKGEVEHTGEVVWTWSKPADFPE